MTHAVDFLHLVDRIVVVENGEIVLDGSYREIKDSVYIKKIAEIHKQNTENAEQEEDGKKETIQVIDEEGKSEDDELVDSADLEKEKKVIKKTLDILSKSTAKEGKMIKDENTEETRVGFRVYKRYQELSGGWIVFAVIIIIMILFTGLKLVADYWIG